ncbi:MAG: hypothetical protein J7K23_06110 [Thermoproteales archaeon]|nr:hypothetical protein [Thermoproteales archaeon]
MSDSDFLPAEKVKKIFLKRYNENPKNWSIIQKIDERKFINTFILNPEESWLLKEYPVNPYKTLGLGTTIDVKKDIIHRFSKPGFGFRPLPDTFLEKISSQSDLEIRKIIIDALRKSPRPYTELDKKIVLGGPLYVANDSSFSLDLISDEQRKLDKKLALELEKLVRKKYPQSYSLYV